MCLLSCYINWPYAEILFSTTPLTSLFTSPAVFAVPACMHATKQEDLGGIGAYLDRPQPGSLHSPPALGRHSILVPRADYGQRRLLGDEGVQLLTQQRAPEVGGQRRALLARERVSAGKGAVKGAVSTGNGAVSAGKGAVKGAVSTGNGAVSAGKGAGGTGRGAVSTGRGAVSTGRGAVSTGKGVVSSGK
jgi:hypothetical protein